VRHHHENWDGSGYPANISGPDIPLGARILSVVDCFDALTSDRPYRPKLSDEDAFAIIDERRATMYDPLVVDTFVRVYADIAPAAIKAGQEARSMLKSADVPTSTDPEQDGSLGEIRSSAHENFVLAELRDALKSSTTDVDAAAAATSSLNRLIPASIYVFYAYDTTRDMLVVKFSLGDERRLTSGIEIRTGERITGWTAATLRLSLNSDAHLDLGGLADAFDPPLRTTLSAPLTHGGTLMGVLSIYGSKTDAFTASHRYIIEHVSTLLATSLSGLIERQHGHVVAFRASNR
jgi:GAF domain-containing protein